MGLPISLKQANRSDWKTVLKIEQSALSKYYSTGVTKKDILDYIRDETILLAFVENQIVGKISYTNKDENITISGLVILPKWRGKDMGTRLSKHIIDMFPKAKAFTLTVHPKNRPALKIYKKLGFKSIKILTNPYGDNEPRLLMKLNDLLSK